MHLLKNIWLILFILWGLPLTFYRSKFRKLVYQTDKWTINIKPYFMKELKALFVNKQFGVPTNLMGLLPGRVTYIADKTGKVIYIFNSQIQAEKHVDEALRILQDMK
jgi:peroxiredoxin